MNGKPIFDPINCGISQYRIHTKCFPSLLLVQLITSTVKYDLSARLSSSNLLLLISFPDFYEYVNRISNFCTFQRSPIKDTHQSSVFSRLLSVVPKPHRTAHAIPSQLA